MLLLVTFAVSVGVSAQRSFIRDANKEFRNENYIDAVDKCETAYKKISPKSQRAIKLKADMAYKCAESHRLTLNDEEAIKWYQRAIDLKYYEVDPNVYYQLGEMHRIQGEYGKAKENYEEHLALVPGNVKSTNALKSCEEAIVFIDNPTRYLVENETKINSKGLDMVPVIGDKKGKTMIFSSTRSGSTGSDKDPHTGDSFFDLWVTAIDKKGNWGEPKVFDAPGVNTEDNEGTIAFDGRYKKMFFTRCPNVKKENLGCEIWVANAKGRKWDEPSEIKLGQHDTISVGHPCASDDGKFLIFASDLPGGKGGKDLWYTTYDRKADTWSKPINMEALNTPSDELFPTFALNGDLLFASNGHAGLGGLDIFRASKIGDEMKWEEPKNVGAPINSKDNDYSLTEIDKRNGLFTSNRRGSAGSKKFPDIWSYKLPPNLFDLKVIVAEVSADASPIEGAKVIVSSSNGTFSGVTNDEGKVFWDKKSDGSRYLNEETDYTITIEDKEGFYPLASPSVFTTKGLDYDQQFVVEMGLFPKRPIRLPEVRYDLGKSALQVNDSVNSKDSLRFVFDMLNDNPGLVIKLLSHTDARGSASANEKLAQARAESCVNYLVNELGVNPERLVAVGKGENSPREVYRFTGTDEFVTTENIASHDGRPYTTILLKESLINSYKRSNRALFDRLHQYNRRTEGAIVRMDWVPAPAAPAPAPGSN